MNIARASKQITLLELEPTIAATSNASARNAYGQAAQEIVCAALGLQPIPINGNYPVCFDAEKDNHFYEIKSVKRGCKVVCYKWRLDKERPFHDILDYAILVHRVRKARENIMWRLLEGAEILVIKSHVLHSLARQCPLNTIKRAHLNKLKRGQPHYNGYTREGYRDGYFNVPVNALFGTTTHAEEIQFRLYGKESSITVNYDFKR